MLLYSSAFPLTLSSPRRRLHHNKHHAGPEKAGGDKHWDVHRKKTEGTGSSKIWTRQLSNKFKLVRGYRQWISTLGKNKGVLQREGLVSPKENNRQWQPSLSPKSHTRLCPASHPFGDLARAPSDRRWWIPTLLVKLLRGQAELFRLETPNLPLGCHKANNNSKPCYSPILGKERVLPCYQNCCHTAGDRIIPTEIWSHCSI